MSKDAIKRKARNQEYREALAAQAASDTAAAKLLAKRERDARNKREKRAAERAIQPQATQSMSCLSASVE